MVADAGRRELIPIALSAHAPEEWDISITPLQVASLSPRESSTCNIMANTPADTVAGDYIIALKALSDQLESEETQLRVTAQASTSWGLIGFGVAGVVIIGLVIVFIYFKMR